MANNLAVDAIEECDEQDQSRSGDRRRGVDFDLSGVGLANASQKAQ